MPPAAPESPAPEPAAPGMAYRMAPALAARLVGLLLVVVALVMFAVTALVAALQWSPDVVVVVAALGLLAVMATGWLLSRGVYVVRFDAAGYRVRMVRGAGVRAAAWTDVADAATATPRGIACVVIRLNDGRTTTIPVAALAVDREQFVRDLQQHLQRGQGLRRL